MTISQRQLLYFIAVVEAGSFSRAAKSVGVAQSALSHQISGLETLLGTRLLERRAKGTVTTTAGERLYGHAKSIAAAFSNAEFDVRTFSQRPTGRITVVMAHPVVDPLTLPFVRAVREHLPDVQITLHEYISTLATERILLGLSDFALVYDPKPDPRLETISVIEEELFLVGVKEMIGSGSTPVNLSSLSHAPMLPPRPLRHQRALKKRQMLRDQVEASEWLEVDSHSAVRQMLVAGMACSILTRASIEPELRTGLVHHRPIRNPGVLWNLHLIWSLERPRTKAFLAVRELILDVIRSEVFSGRWPARWLLEEKPPTPQT